MSPVSNMLVEGVWREGVRQTQTESGEYKRQETTFRNRVPPEEVERGRYHLYISRSCPWAHGVALVRALQGLDGAVSLNVVDPVRKGNGWEFSPEIGDCTPDTANGCDYLYEAYAKADPNYTGHVNVPVLWDTQEETIVNNESIEIMRNFATVFTDISQHSVDLYPEDKRDEIDRIIEAIYEPINNGVYRAGFADIQEVYEAAVTDVFDALDHWESVLSNQRYLTGTQLTLADVRLFPTLVRFDPVYHTHFKCNIRRLVDYSNLWNYTKELYQLPGVADTVVTEQLKPGYYREHTDFNPKRIVPLGPDIDFTEPHDRDRLPGGPPQALS